MRNKILEINQIVIDEKLFPREKVNENTVKEYVRAIGSGDQFPPVYVGFYNGKNYLIDGRHRYESYKLCGEKYIQCEIKDNFPTFDDMFLASIKANLKHGLRFTKKDKIKVAITMSNMKFTLDDVSNLSGVPIKEIQRFNMKLKPILSLKKQVETGKLPEVISQKVIQKEDIKVAEVVEGNKEELQIYQLEDIYNFFIEEELITDDKRIFNFIRNIKRTLKKKYPKL